MGYNNPYYLRDIQSIQEAAEKLHNGWLELDKLPQALKFRATTETGESPEIRGAATHGAADRAAHRLTERFRQDCVKEAELGLLSCVSVQELRSKSAGTSQGSLDVRSIVVEILSGDTCTLNVSHEITTLELKPRITAELENSVQDLSSLQLHDTETGKELVQDLDPSLTRVQAVLVPRRQLLSDVCKLVSPCKRSKEENIDFNECLRCHGHEPFKAKTVVKGGLISGSHKAGANFRWCPTCGFLVWHEFSF
jgi:hypothetical protein